MMFLETINEKIQSHNKCRDKNLDLTYDNNAYCLCLAFFAISAWTRLYVVSSFKELQKCGIEIESRAFRSEFQSQKPLLRIIETNKTFELGEEKQLIATLATQCKATQLATFRKVSASPQMMFHFLIQPQSVFFF